MLDITRFLIALEADDITGEVETEKAEVVGGNADVDVGGVDNLDSQLDELGEVAGTEEDATEEPTETEGDEDESIDDEGDNENVTSEEPPAEEPPEEKTPEYLNKNTVKNNLIHLHGVVSSEIDRLSESINYTNNQTTVEVVNNALVNLRNIKKYSFEIITKEIAESDYPTVLGKYISLKRVYELTAQMIFEYFKSQKDTK